ncbi:MAG: four helix bundle protein [Patescibacteria group bacterium]
MDTEKTKGYKNLKVWQRSVELALATYELTEKFPKSEIYGLISQMRRASISIPSNIAEGSRRRSNKDFSHFLVIAQGSGSELETHIEITKQLSFSKNLDYSRVDSLLDETMRMLSVLITKIKL